MDFKEIIKFSTEDYKTESNTGWFMDTFHLILWGSGWLLFAFGGFMGFVFFLAFLHTATRGFGDWDALLLIIGTIILSLAISYGLKKLRVKLFYKGQKKT